MRVPLPEEECRFLKRELRSSGDIRAAPTENCVATVLTFPYASLATPPATSTVTVPSALGVIVAVYVVPLPDRDTEAPLMEISPTTKSATDSPKVIVTVNVEPVATPDSELVIVVDGPVPS